MHQYHFSQFDNLVNSLSAKYHKDSLHDSDDIKQELLVKLVETLPALTKVPPKEILVLVYTILKNEIRGIQRKSITRSHLNCKLAVDHSSEDQAFGWEDTADKAIMSLKCYMPEPFVSPENNASYSMLYAHMMDFAEYKGGKTAVLINEILNPSDSTLATWKDMVNKFPTYKKFEQIPPSSFAKILGISKISIHKIMVELRKHLETVGYNKEYLKIYLTMGN